MRRWHFQRRGYESISRIVMGGSFAGMGGWFVSKRCDSVSWSFKAHNQEDVLSLFVLFITITSVLWCHIINGGAFASEFPEQNVRELHNPLYDQECRLLG